MPLLSVFLPNYNHEKYLRQSIDSVLIQSFKDFELIIIDDGSTDKSWEIISEYAKKDSRIVPEKFAKNQGVCKAIERSIELCKGKFVFGRASDDYISNPYFFEEAMHAMTLYPDAAGVFAGCALENDTTGEIFGNMGYYKGDGSLFSFIPKERACTDFLTNRLFIPGASAIWKHQLIQQIGGFPEELGPQCDYFLNHTLPMLHGVVVLHNCALVVRALPNSYSAKASPDAFFRRHALVEKKIRALVKNAKEHENWITWRQTLIDSKIPTFGISKWQSWVDSSVFWIKFLGRILRKAERSTYNQWFRYKQWRAHALFNKITK